MYNGLEGSVFKDFVFFFSLLPITFLFKKCRNRENFMQQLNAIVLKSESPTYMAYSNPYEAGIGAHFQDNNPLF